jgi:DNA-binding Lrp family transcriptional regulator
MQALEASRIITDEYSAKILLATLENPKTAVELNREMNIPIAACYRRIRTLEKQGLLKCVEVRSTFEGKHIATYESILKRASVFLENGTIKTRFEMVSGESEDFFMDWHGQRKE